MLFEALARITVEVFIRNGAVQIDILIYSQLLIIHAYRF